MSRCSPRRCCGCGSRGWHPNPNPSPNPNQVLRVWEPGMAPADVLAKTLQPVTDVISAEDRGAVRTLAYLLTLPLVLALALARARTLRTPNPRWRRTRTRTKRMAMVVLAVIRLWKGSASRCPLLAKAGCRCFENERRLNCTAEQNFGPPRQISLSHAPGGRKGPQR